MYAIYHTAGKFQVLLGKTFVSFTNGLAFAKLLLCEKSLELFACNRRMPNFLIAMIASDLRLKNINCNFLSSHLCRQW